jgi:hypothetical protein
MVAFQFTFLAFLINVTNSTNDDETRLYGYKIISIVAPISFARCISLFLEITSEEHNLAVRLEKISIKD